MSTVKVTCPRCNGSGKFSFNLMRGTVCFGCQGVGFKMVDPVKQAKANALKLKRANERAILAQERNRLYEIFAAEIDTQFGPFPDTAKGSYDRMTACQRANGGKTIGDLIADSLAATQSARPDKNFKEISTCQTK